MKLLIDDMRNIEDGVIARNYEAGRKMLAIGGWSVLYIDHDLGEGKTGYDLLNWASQADMIPDTVTIVSSNPVGVENIGRLLRAEGYRCLGRTFKRI